MLLLSTQKRSKPATSKVSKPKKAKQAAPASKKKAAPADPASEAEEEFSSEDDEEDDESVPAVEDDDDEEHEEEVGDYAEDFPRHPEDDEDAEVDKVWVRYPAPVFASLTHRRFVLQALRTIEESDQLPIGVDPKQGFSGTSEVSVHTFKMLHTHM